MDRSKRNAAEKGIITAFVGWVFFAILAITIAFATHCNGAERTPEAIAIYSALEELTDAFRGAPGVIGTDATLGVLTIEPIRRKRQDD